MEQGPFATEDKEHADAYLLPVQPYRTRVNAYPDAGLDEMQAQAR